MRKCIPVIMIILFLTGCFQYSISIHFDPDQGGDISHHVYISKSLIDMDYDDIEEEIDDDSITITQNDEYIILTRIIHIEPEHFADNGININKENGRYTAVFDPYTLMRTDNKEFNPSMGSIFTMDITVSSGKITGHNGDSINGNKVFFTVPYTVRDEYELPEIAVRTAWADMTLYIVVFAAIVILLAGIVIIQLKGKK